MKYSDEILMAFADGELDGTMRAEIEAAMATDPALARAVERHRALAAHIRARYEGVAVEPVPDRIAALVSAPESAPVADLAARRRARTSSIQAFFMIPNIQLSMRDPGRHWPACVKAFSTATCTRSSASATCRVMTRANRRRRGNRAASSVRNASSAPAPLMMSNVRHERFVPSGRNMRHETYLEQARGAGMLAFPGNGPAKERA